METREINITIPEGFEIDKEKSTFLKIIFKKKEPIHPKTWEEYVVSPIRGKIFCFDTIGEIHRVTSMNRAPCSSRIHFNTEEEAKAFRALMQLRQLRKAWVGDWKPDKNAAGIFNSPYVHVIRPYVGFSWSIELSAADTFLLAFPTKEMAEEFAECFKDLLKEARPLFSC